MKKSKHTMFWVIVITITAMTLLLVHNTIQRGGIDSNGSKGTETYKSLEDAQAETSLNLFIPDGIDTSKILEIRSVMGQIIEIRSEHYVLKAASFVNENADPLGLYDKSEVDTKYTIKDSDITFFRYRTGYTGYEGCTLLNWCTKTTALGIMLDEVISEDDAFNIMGIDINKIVPYRGDNSSGDTDSGINTPVNWETHQIADNVEISLPEIECGLRTVEFDGYTILYLNDSRCLVVVYSDFAIDAGVFDGQGQINVDEHTRLNYLSENNFDVNSAEYRDYELILNNIQDIANSITKY